MEREEPQHLPYRIEYVQTAIAHLRFLTALQRSVELRLGDLRVDYDVEE